jgi:hypothetical protein
MVRIAGLEPAHLAALPPQSSVSANSTICATANNEAGGGGFRKVILDFQQDHLLADHPIFIRRLHRFSQIKLIKICGNRRNLRIQKNNFSVSQKPLPSARVAGLA